MTVSKAARYARIYAGSLLAYFLARQFTPLLYPYKQFMSDTNREILAIVLRSFARFETYAWPPPFLCFVYFGVINLLCFPLLRRQRAALTIAFNLMLGFYFGIMIDGFESVNIDAHLRFDVFSRWPNLSQSPVLEIVPLFLKIGIPILVAFALAKAGAAMARRESPPHDPDGLASA